MEYALAFITVPLLVGGYVAYRYVKKRRGRKRELGGGKRLDPALIRATIVYFNIHSDEAARISLPPQVLQSLVRTQAQMPELERSTIDNAIQAWMAHFEPRLNVAEESSRRRPDALSAALMKLILEDSD